MKRIPYRYRYFVRRTFSLYLVVVVVFCAASFAQGQEDEEEFVQEGVRSSSDSEAESDPFVLFLQAQDAHEKGDLEKALSLYSEALAEHPEFPEAEYQMGMIYMSLGFLEKSELSFRKAVKYKPDWTLAMAGLGSVLVRRGNFDEAEQVLANALKIDGMSFPAYVALTDSYLSRTTPIDKIRSLYTRLVYITSKSKVPGTLWSSRAALERTLGDFGQARKSIRRSLELDPNNRRALEEEVELSIALADHEAAINLADALVSRYPNDTGAKILLARGHALKGDYEKALEILDAVKELDDRAHGIARAIRVSVDETDIPRLEAALTDSPENTALLGRLCAAFRVDDPKKALEYCRKAFELEPGNLAHAIGFGAALVQMRQYESAVRVLEELKLRDPENHTVRANLATAYFQLAKFESAKTEYRWIVDKQPKLPAGYYFLAITYDRLNEYVDAMANYQQFLRVANETEFETEIGRVRLRLGPLQKQIEKGRKN